MQNQFFSFSCSPFCFLDMTTKIQSDHIFVGFVIVTNNFLLTKLIAKIWERVDVTKSNRSVGHGKKQKTKTKTRAVTGADRL